MTAETYTFNNQTHTIAEWARLTNIPYSVLVQRLRVRKWPPERALTEPVQQRHGGVRKRQASYMIDVTFQGRRHFLSGFRTEPQAKLARDELLRRLQAKHAVTAYNSTEAQPNNPTPDLTANLGNVPYVHRLPEDRQYKVNGRLAPVRTHLRDHGIAPTSFYRLQRQTNLPIQDLLTLLLEHGLSFTDIRSRFKASEK